MRVALAARQAAFAYTRFAPDPGHDIDAEVRIALASTLSDTAQPGAAHPHAAVLRQEWHLGSADVMAMQAQMPLLQPSQADGALTLARYTAVLRGAGHSAGDAQTQQRAANSALGWQTAARRSTSAGQSVATRLNQVDLAWGRSQPTFDWWRDWTAKVPSEFLRQGGRRP